MLKEYNIWSEGYIATGGSGKAYFHSKQEGLNFKDACKKFAEKDKDFAKYFDEKRMTYWGCKLFADESLARESFG